MRLFEWEEYYTQAFCILCIGVGLSTLLLVRAASAADVETHIIVFICGDGVIQTTEEICDDGTGNNLGQYGSSTAERHCAPGCAVYGPYCGDGILQTRHEEECDDQNTDDEDLCSTQCRSLVGVAPGGGGAPQVGSTPNIPEGTKGIIPSQTETKVILKGKGFPNRDVNILLDGKAIGVVRADSSANFSYSTTDITPGTATFGFWSRDGAGTDSITASVVFDVVQSAVTTVANVFIPPTARVSEKQIAPGELLLISGQSIPSAGIIAQIFNGPVVFNSETDRSGAWALQVDTASLSSGYHLVRAAFELGSTTKSGFGRSVNFYIGGDSPLSDKSPDLNGDGKVNLVDFSIFLLSWNTDNDRPDFNSDGKVNLGDFSIMLFNWTG
jgi:cysteine-rich repeat protein